MSGITDQAMRNTLTLKRGRPLDPVPACGWAAGRCRGRPDAGTDGRITTCSPDGSDGHFDGHEACAPISEQRPNDWLTAEAMNDESGE